MESEAGTTVRSAYWWPAWALVNLGAFATGLVLPLVTVSRLYIFNTDIVLYRVPQALAANGEWLLAAVVALFGIVFPVAKTLVYVVAPFRPRIALFVGKFAPVAFFDIFMVALLIFVAKGGFASDATTAVGLYPLLFFACSSKLIEWSFARTVARSAASNR